MGIIHSPSQKDTKKLINNIVKEDKNKYENIVFLKCIYKKGKPVFRSPSDEILNPGKYMWDFNKFDKYIPISSQAFAMLSQCKFAQLVYERDKNMGLLLLYNAKLHFNFINAYLKDEEGLFLCAEDKTKDISDKIKLKQDSKTNTLLHQLYVYEAFLMLYTTTSNDSSKEYYDKNCDQYLKQARLVFDYIYSNYFEMLELSTKEITYCILSLSRCCKFEKDENRIMNYHHLIVSLCAELESRIKITGEVEKSSTNNTTASFMTHIKCSFALIEGYIECNINKFKELALRIYNYIDAFYDENTCIYNTDFSDEVGYSIKDIVEICCLLYKLYLIDFDKNILDRLRSFYDICIQNSGIIQSTTYAHELFDNNSNFNINLPYFEEINTPPVFFKNFKFNSNADITISASKSFNSSYSLYASYLFSHYFCPVSSKNPSEDIVLTHNETSLKEETIESKETILQEEILADDKENVTDKNITHTTTTKDTI